MHLPISVVDKRNSDEMDIRKLWYRPYININININICSIELKWDGQKLKYDMIKRWGKYEYRYEMEVIYSDF